MKLPIVVIANNLNYRRNTISLHVSQNFLKALVVSQFVRGKYNDGMWLIIPKKKA